jgi:hypothetical protein
VSQHPESKYSVTGSFLRGVRNSRKGLYGTKLPRVTEEEICTVSNKSPSQTLSSTTGIDDLGVGD